MSALSEPEPDEEKDLPEKKRKGCSGCLLRLGIVGLIFVALLFGVLAWLNGPGLPWIAQKYGPSLFAKAGFEGDLELSGSLLHGPHIDSINLTSETSPLKTLSATNLKLRYNLLDLKDLKIEGLTADTLTVDLDLSQSSPKTGEEKEKEPSKATLKETLEKFRSIATHPELEIGVLNLHVHKGEQNFYRLQDANLAHTAKSDTFFLTPGTVTDFQNKTFDPPVAEITWNDDHFSLLKIPLAQDISIPDLTFEIEPILLDGNINVFESIINFNTDVQSTVTASLGQKTLDLGPILEIVPAAEDATCEIKEFQATASNLNQEFSQWTLDLNLALDNLTFQDRVIPETTLELAKDGLQLDTSLRADLPDQPQTITLITNFAPETAQAPGTAWKNSSSDLTTELLSLSSFLSGIAPPLNLPVPPDGWPEGQALLLANIGITDGKPSASKLSLTFNRLNWAEAEFEKGELVVNYVDADSDIKADLTIEQSATSTLTSRASYGPNNQEYAATFSAKNFDAMTLQPFIRLSLGDFPLTGTITLDWQGTGTLPDINSHRGKLSLAQTRVTIDKQSPIALNLDADYEGLKKVEITQLQIQQNDQFLQLKADWNGERVDLSELSLTQKQRQTVSGKASLPLSLDMDFKNYLTLEAPWSAQIAIERLDIPETAELVGFAEKLPPDLNGDLTFNLDLSGTPAQPNLKTGLLLNSAQTLQANAAWDGKRIDISNLSLSQNQKRLVIGQASLPLSLDTDFKNYLSLNQPWTAQFAVDRLDIPETAELAGFSDKLPPNFEGMLTFNLDVSGSPAAPLINSSLLFEAAQRLQADIAWDGKRVDVSNLALIQSTQQLVTGDISVPLALDTDFKNYLTLEEPWSVGLNIDRLDIPETAELLGQGEKLPEGLSGILSLDVNVAGTPAAPSLGGNLLLDSFALKNLSELPPTTARLTWATAGTNLTLDGTIEPDGSNPLTITGNTAFFPKKWTQNPESFLDENFSARIDAANIELAPFADLSPVVKTLDGNIVVQVRADGTFRKPNLTGELELDLPKARFDIERLRRVRQTSLKLDFADNKINIAPFSTSVDGGLLDLSGTVDISDTSNPAFDLRLTVEKALLWRDDNINARADAALFLKGSLQQANLSGEIGVVESLFYKDIELLPLNVPVSTPKAPKLPSLGRKVASTGSGNAVPVPEPFANWTLDVKARTADPFLIRGNLTEGEVDGEIFATGTLGNPELNGELVIEELSASLPFSTLTIEGGKAVFSPENGFIPALDIRAQSRIPPFEADIFVSGSATSPSISFATNPPLPESEVITLLATGTTTEALGDSDAAKSKAFQLFIEQVRRAPPGSPLHPFAKIAEPLKDVELQIAGADPFTGKRRNSATVPLPNSKRWFLTAAADNESNTRVLVLYILKFN